MLVVFALASEDAYGADISRECLNQEFLTHDDSTVLLMAETTSAT